MVPAWARHDFFLASEKAALELKTSRCLALTAMGARQEPEQVHSPRPLSGSCGWAYDTAAAELLTLTRRHPQVEEFWSQRTPTLSRLERHADALAVHQEARRVRRAVIGTQVAARGGMTHRTDGTLVHRLCRTRVQFAAVEVGTVLDMSDTDALLRTRRADHRVGAGRSESTVRGHHAVVQARDQPVAVEGDVLDAAQGHQTVVDPAGGVQARLEHHRPRRHALGEAAVREELAALRKENAQIKRANEVLRTASAFSAAPLDPTRPR
ncbi:hypothetical protein C6376_36670 [Streptomyces sp. P3]|nr:hypothetical protein C6376_36670 [Streptomyces sp. P3]